MKLLHNRLTTGLCALILVLAACQRSEVYMEYRPVSSAAWETNDKVEFELGPVPEDGIYLLSVDLRTTETSTYPYQELMIEARQLWSRDDDAANDSICHVNDSLCSLYRKEMAEQERLIRHNIEAFNLYNDDDETEEEKPKPKRKRHRHHHDDDDDDDAPRISPRDSALAVTDSLDRAFHELRDEVRRLTSINDTIEVERARRVHADTICFNFHTGEMRSTGIVVRQYSQPVRTLQLSQGQTAHIALRHIMRLEAIPGISDVGLRLEKE